MVWLGRGKEKERDRDREKVLESVIARKFPQCRTVQQKIKKSFHPTKDIKRALRLLYGALSGGISIEIASKQFSFKEQLSGRL
jgi:hypothetical protein